MKTVLFDLFGTLTTGVANPEARIIESYGLSFDELFVEKFVCGTKFTDQASYLKKVIEGIGLEYSPENVERVSVILAAEIAKERILEDCESVLKRFKDAKYRIGLISNAPNPDYDMISSNGLKDYFDSVIFSYELGLFKPGKEIFERALKELNAEPNAALMVGNSMKSDMVGARNAGIDGILISADDVMTSGVIVVHRLADVFEAAERYFQG